MTRPIYFLAGALLLASCSASKLQTSPNAVSGKVYSDEVLKVWPHSDPFKSGSPGIHLAAAYEALKGMPSKKVVVGIIDSGVDINHEDLKEVIWTNPNEIPNNGIDDDKNGYIDDIHGWNFLGDILAENMEITRIVKQGASHPDYQRALKEYEKQVSEAQENVNYLKLFKEGVFSADKYLQTQTGKTKYTKEDLASLDKNEGKNADAVQIVSIILSIFNSVEEGLKELEKGLEYYDGKLKYHLNKDFNPRKTILKDDENNFAVKSYGNNNVIGPELSGSEHGTHVAGIVAAVRDNNLGGNGVANNVAIMAVRAVPDGDEYDKDIALAIRYAVDNGAKVINTSFGKGFSPKVEWVREALKYAASKDVLIVNAAGNDSKNIDTEITFPDDNISGVEFVDNFIAIGALNYEYNEKIVADFSNYGKKNVDIFSPGVKIYATLPGNEYGFLQGTSMASPEVAGIAALIRSYFPSLTAKQVKQIILESGVTPNLKEVIVGGDESNKKPLSEISKTGKIVNAYNAVLLAKKMVKK